ncbi:MAG TPA: diphosphomevalonate decarboxylase [Rhodanobacteraceae bacterium]|nr:diphosphomevalonate decarboxylase [Rhodanobacteraceae bacterium]
MTGIALAHPNIALVKYWGKREAGANVPATGSLSITLDALTTRTRVEFDDALKHDELLLDGEPDTAALARVGACLDSLRALAGDHRRARVETRNDFPTAAGLASSASGFAALVIAASAALGLELDRRALSKLARRASGSAARSLYGGFVVLHAGRKDDDDPPAQPLLDAEAWPLGVVVAITRRARKQTGSRAGMESSRRTSPFYEAWLRDADRDLAVAQAAVLARDFAQLAEISEHNCLKMHAVMLSSRPPLAYWNGTTLECMRRVRELREREGLRVFFTIDAGPQVKAICMPQDTTRVAEALAAVAGVESVLESRIGEGARLLRTEQETA